MITAKLILLGIAAYHALNVVAMVALDWGYSLLRWQCQVIP